MIPRTPLDLSAIDRSTPPEDIKEFRAEVDISAQKLADFFHKHLNTVQRWEKLGAPRLIFYALVGIAVVELGLDPWKLKMLRNTPRPGAAQGDLSGNWDDPTSESPHREPAR